MSEKASLRGFIAPRFWLLWVALGAVFCISLLPWRLRHGLGALLGTLAWRFNHKRRNIVLVNLAACFPEQSPDERLALARRHFALVGRSIIDLSMLWFGSDKRLDQMIDVVGWQHIETTRAEGLNVICHVAHSVGLEFGAIGISSRRPGIGFYKPAKNPLVNALILRSRQRFDNLLITRDQGVRSYIKALRGGRILYYLSDEDLGAEHSEFVSLFAATKATLPAAGRMSQLAKARVIPAITLLDDKTGRYRLELDAPLEDFPHGSAEQDARHLNQALERLIERDPAQYMWFLKLLRTQPDGSDLYQKGR